MHAGCIIICLDMVRVRVYYIRAYDFHVLERVNRRWRMATQKEASTIVDGKRVGLSELEIYRAASDAVNYAVSSVMDLEVQLRQARGDERRARQALARLPRPKDV